MRLNNILLMVIFSLFIFGCGKAQNKSNRKQGTVKQNNTYRLAEGVLGTYATPPRLPNGKVDKQKLIDELKDIHANTYSWLIWKGEKDFQELIKFLPMARQAGLKVWVTLVPPSEPPAPKPFGYDYIKWAEELATLSKKYPNLVAWSIDDFSHNLDLYTPKYVKKMVSRGREINPEFVFVPTSYYRGIINNKDYFKNIKKWLGGILFPYRAASSDKLNLKGSQFVKRELAKLHSLFGQNFPIVVDVYASAHSSLGSTTPAYVKSVINTSLKYAEGVMIFTHQDPQEDPKKYNIIKEAFGRGLQ